MTPKIQWLSRIGLCLYRYVSKFLKCPFPSQILYILTPLSTYTYLAQSFTSHYLSHHFIMASENCHLIPITTNVSLNVYLPLSLSPNFNVKIVSVVNFSPQHPGLFLIERELSALFVPHCNFQFFASFSPQNPTPLKFMWPDWLHQCLQHFITPAVTFHVTRFFF